MNVWCLSCPPGVAGAIVPGVCGALIVVKLHPRDQVQKPEISALTFHIPLGILMRGHWKFMSHEVHQIQSPGVILPRPCNTLGGATGVREQGKYGHCQTKRHQRHSAKVLPPLIVRTPSITNW